MAVLRRSKRLMNKRQCIEPSQFSVFTYEDSGFMSILPNEVLLEILFRLPNRRSVFRCITVCKRWFSLINANRHYFESLFVTILFSFSPYNEEQILHELFPEQSLILERRISPSIEPCVLDFLPDWPHIAVRASCGELLLVSRSLVHYFICNPRTRKWIALPEAPPIPKDYTLVNHGGYGLVFRVSKKICTIVIANLIGIYYNFYRIVLSIYSSQTLQWISSSKEFEYPPKVNLSGANRGLPCLDLVGTGGGILHWLGPRGRGESKLRGVIALNPFSLKLRFTKLPCESWCFRRVCGPYPDRVRLGVVAGKLRLSRICKVNQICFGLKIWELEDGGSDEDYGSWNLMHSVSLKRVKSMVFLLALHPTDGDVVFVVCDSEIFRFDIQLNKYEKVGDLPGNYEPLNVLKEKVASHMKVFPLSHSLWPTPVPQIPPPQIKS